MVLIKLYDESILNNTIEGSTQRLAYWIDEAIRIGLKEILCLYHYSFKFKEKVKNIIANGKTKDKTARSMIYKKMLQYLSNITLEDKEKKECSLYDTFLIHIHKRPELNPFLVNNHDTDEEDNEFDADLTIISRKSTDWIISRINIREKLTNYQFEVNSPKTHPKYYDINFFNLNDGDSFLRILDKSIIVQMRKEIKMAKADMANADKAIIGLLKYEVHFLWASSNVIEAIKITIRMIHTSESNKKAENTTSTKKMKKKKTARIN
ncbi:1117_t:CDS:2 [Funneliformis mosseae]|uniref:1117_t:CDS:1 n=1 Tax=Funneliformis mosseae TaxID=27381 RepID=A0A9N8VCC4_FUNMO|nr:1117_t:CDS:2 [Funneliformis mosseae]